MIIDIFSGRQNLLSEFKASLFHVHDNYNDTRKYLYVGFSSIFTKRHLDYRLSNN